MKGYPSFWGFSDVTHDHSFSLVPIYDLAHLYPEEECLEPEWQSAFILSATSHLPAVAALRSVLSPLLHKLAPSLLKECRGGELRHW